MKAPAPQPAFVVNSLLSIAADAKTVKGQELGFLTGVIYLAPVDIAVKGVNLCPHASAGCKAACLYTAGRGSFTATQQARINRTILFIKHNAAFSEMLDEEIHKLCRKAKRAGLTPTVRLNGTSDIAWERCTLNGRNVFERHPDVQFYDYTKSAKRMLDWKAGKFPANYHLTFSRSESNAAEVDTVLSAGGSVAAVFAVKKGDPLPSHYNGIPVIDGDLSDVRFLDPSGCYVGLRAKGKALRDKSGFVIQDF